ncbi:uncharacterized protein sp100.1 isoform 2-T2 [Polymixia lowei]
MDLEWLDDEQLERFFRCNKTVMSCMEKPQIFLNQLRDHHLIPEKRYQKVIRMRSKDNMKSGIYSVLDWLETKTPEHIKLFWDCVFTDNMLKEYPTLCLLRDRLMNGPFQFYEKLPEKVEEEEKEDKKRKEPPEDGEEKQEKKGQKKRRQRSGSVTDPEEQPGPSSQLTSGQRRRVRKPSYGSPLKKGQTEEIWNWPIYKTQLPVTCGDKKGTLSRDRLAKGKKCIYVDKRWFTPAGFEEFAGKKSCRNWKLSIRCRDATLEKLIQENHLKCSGYKTQCKTAKNSLFPSNQSEGLITESDIEKDEGGEEEQALTTEIGCSTESSDTEEEEEEEEPDGGHDRRNKPVFKVTCGTIAGTLHKVRFASGTAGKSIRTETSWMSPTEFAVKGLSQPVVSWRKDIQWEGKPLSVLLETGVLGCHGVNCKCRLCRPTPEDLEDEKNDDECFICRSDGVTQLVVCEQCPRSFHQRCHLPHLEDAMLEDDRPWTCTFCVLKGSQAWLYPRRLTYDTALSWRISEHLGECQYLLLSLYHADEDQIFTTNPSLHVRGYSTLIKTPMWLDKVAEKLQNNNYQTVEEFVSDIRLIFTNCATFNRDNAEFRAMGVRLKESFEREFKDVFGIQQETLQ